ncbi:unnamed protein product, partial [Ectocarpus sp. 4 AP-2014]
VTPGVVLTRIAASMCGLLPFRKVVVWYMARLAKGSFTNVAKCERPVSLDQHFVSRAWRVSAFSMIMYFAFVFVGPYTLGMEVRGYTRCTTIVYSGSFLGRRTVTGILWGLGPSVNVGFARIGRCNRDEITEPYQVDIMHRRG